MTPQAVAGWGKEHRRWSQAWLSLLTGHEFTCEPRPSLLSVSVSHCKMITLFLFCEPTPSLRKKSERGGDQGSMVNDALLDAKVRDPHTETCSLVSPIFGC